MKLWAERQIQLHLSSFIESEVLFITKPFDVANYFNDYFIGKVGKLRQEMPTTNSEQLYSCIKKFNNEKPPGIDNLDGKLLRMVADFIATPIVFVLRPGGKPKPFHFPRMVKWPLLVLTADYSTLYESSTTASEFTATLNKTLQSVLEWVASYKLVLNITKTKSIVFGTNHSLISRPQLNLVIKGVTVEQVEETK